jgi:integrase/recombinase XerC
MRIFHPRRFRLEKLRYWILRTGRFQRVLPSEGRLNVTRHGRFRE